MADKRDYTVVMSMLCTFTRNVRAETFAEACGEAKQALATVSRDHVMARLRDWRTSTIEVQEHECSVEIPKQQVPISKEDECLRMLEKLKGGADG